jgi:hypothetical protein
MKVSNIKFHENPSSGIRYATSGQTGELANMTKTMCAFREYANAPELRPYFNVNLVTVHYITSHWYYLCATSRKVACSIPDGVIGIFDWHNRFGRTMALGSTQSLTEMSTRRPVRRADNLTTFMCRLSRNLGASTSRNLRACPGL